MGQKSKSEVILLNDEVKKLEEPNQITALIVDLVVKGYDAEQIKSLTNLDEDTIRNLLFEYKNFIEFLPKSKAYAKNKSSILDAIELKLLNLAFSPTKLKKASFSNLIAAYKVIFDSNRLESGKSTANISASVKFTGDNSLLDIAEYSVSTKATE